MIPYQNKKGFTLLEIILTITAIGILSAIGLVALNPNKQLEAGMEVKRKADMESIVKAIEQYVVNNRGKYPPALQSVVTGGTVGLCVTTPCTNGIDLTADLAPYIVAIPLPQIGQYTITKTDTGIIPGYDSNNIWAIAGSIGPTLDLNFARDKQWVNAVDGTNPISFTRASIGTYVGSDGLIKTAIANEPRFTHNPVTKESLGLFVEEARTNNLLYSEVMDNGYWAKIRATINANVSIAPDGTLTGDKLIEDTQTGVHHLNRGSFPFVSGTTYTLSGFYKAGERTRVRLQLGNNGTPFPTSANYRATFDLLNGTIVSQGSALTQVSVSEFVNGWFRLSITATAQATANDTIFQGFLIESGDISNYTGNGSSGLFIWGSQLELGSFATSYIPTTTGTVQRFLDNASISGGDFTTIPSGWYNQNEGTTFVSAITNVRYGGVNTFPRLFAISDGTNTNSIESYYRVLSGYTDAGYRVDAGTLQSQFDTNNERNGQKISIGYMANNLAFGGGGSILHTNSSGSVPTVNSRLQLGARNTGSTPLNGTIARFMYWPTRLNNTILTDITR